MTDAPVLEARNLYKIFAPSNSIAQTIAGFLGEKQVSKGVHAVSDVSLFLRKGEVLGIVGESGCGKSTLGRILSGVLSPSRGEVRYRDQNILDMSSADRKSAALKIQMIFQNPYASLNPRMRVRDLIGEAPSVHGLVSRANRNSFVSDIMRRVGLDPSFQERFPHQLSGGAAPASRHRPSACGRSGNSRMRRVGGCARRIKPGADPQPIHEAA